MNPTANWTTKLFFPTDDHHEQEEEEEMYGIVREREKAKKRNFLFYWRSWFFANVIWNKKNRKII